MSGSDNDVELIGGIINASGDYDLVTKILRETTTTSADAEITFKYL